MSSDNKPRLNANMFPEVYKALSVDTGELGCIMLDVHPFAVTAKVHEGEADLYFSDKAGSYSQGAVAEKVAHCTLLYGLMESGVKWRDQVDGVLEGWTVPDLVIDHVDFFPSPGVEDYSVIVGKIRMSPELLEGNHRLRLLPHIDTFPEYQPHITLAYIKNGPSTVPWATSAVDKWVQTLNIHLQDRTFDVTEINYGSDD